MHKQLTRIVRHSLLVSRLLLLALLLAACDAQPAVTSPTPAPAPAPTAAPTLVATAMPPTQATAPAPATPPPTAAPPTIGPTTLPPTTAPTMLPSTAAPATPPGGAAAGGPVLHLPAGDFGYTPFNYLLGPGYVRMSLLFDTLIWKDSKGYIPWLATAWQPSADGQRWTFALRPGVKWQDGTPLTVDDVVFTFDYMKKQPPTSPLLRGMEFVSSARKVDEQHVEVALTQAYAPFLQNIAGALPIIPRHVWEKVADPSTFTAPEAAIGSGPYKLTSYDAASGAYLYEANDAFWLGKPFVRRIEMVPTGDDLLALQQGTLDAADVSFPGGATDEVLAQFQTRDYGSLNQLLEFSPVIHFNLAKGAPYTDVNFRRAWAYAIDRAAIVQRVLQGKGQPGSLGWLGPASSWYNPAVEQYKYDPARANALLDAAGYKGRTADGMRKRPDGKPLAVHILGGGGPFARVTELIAAQLKGVGIASSFTSPGDPNAMIEQFARGNYEVGLLFYELGGDPDYMRQVFSSESPPGGYPRAFGYHNARFDQLAAEQLVTSDAAKRKAIVAEMQVILAQDVPVIPLYYGQGYYLYRKATFDAWYYTPGGIGPGVPLPQNKQAFVTGHTTGLLIRGR